MTYDALIYWLQTEYTLPPNDDFKVNLHNAIDSIENSTMSEIERKQARKVLQQELIEFREQLISGNTNFGQIYSFFRKVGRRLPNPTGTLNILEQLARIAVIFGILYLVIMVIRLFKNK